MPEAFIGDTVAAFGRLDVLVNNAGTIEVMPIDGLSEPMLERVFAVNTFAAMRLIKHARPVFSQQKSGRVVNVSSASGPVFVSQCTPQQQLFFQDSCATWNDIQRLLDDVQLHAGDAGYFRALGLGEPNPYGLSKACVNLYTLVLAREHPRLCINACTPGYIETDLTRPQAAQRGATPAELGMKAPQCGTVATLFLLMGAPSGSGHYYGSDAKRSPMDRYRAPGSPEFGSS